MNNTAKKLVEVVHSVKGNGSFATCGTKDSVLPGLSIEGVGEIGLPLSPVLVKAMIEQATKAPFGKGSQTILDTAVRSAWEIDASQLSFHHREWDIFMKKVVGEAGKGLGLEMEKQEVVSSLYKLLIYEEGDFFLPHQDSEKEEGMFATLLINLPSRHEGGELHVRFDGREEVIDFSVLNNGYQLAYAAFFADCTHEIRKVTSGYRVCLVYNLLLVGKEKVTSPQFSTQIAEMTTLLDTLKRREPEEFPKAVFLTHQYTPANFAQTTLKPHDVPRAEALFSAAENAGFFAKLGLVTHYRSGDWVVDDYYNPNPEDGEMGEIFDEYTSIEYWGKDGIPALDEMDIEEENLLTEIEIGEGDPMEEEAEGFTGNEGMTLEYWYHYGAVILWPKEQHAGLLHRQTVPVKLAWMEYFLAHWDSTEPDAEKTVREMITKLSGYEYKRDEEDFSVLGPALEKINDMDFLQESGRVLLRKVFDKIKVENWISLLHRNDLAVFEEVFQEVGRTGDVFRLHHLLRVLQSLTDKETGAFVQTQVDNIPGYLREVEWAQLKETEDEGLYVWDSLLSRKETIEAVVAQLLVLCESGAEKEAWTGDVLSILTACLNREYVNEVLTVVLLRMPEAKSRLFEGLYGACVQHLTESADNKPQPLPDWRRPVPEEPLYYKDVWEILRPFMESPTQQILEYKKAQSYRKQMERAIDDVTVDLKTETIRKGSPHTLRIIKTHANYERELAKWHEDLALLKRLKALRG